MFIEDQPHIKDKPLKIALKGLGMLFRVFILIVNHSVIKLYSGDDIQNRQKLTLNVI